MFGHFWKTDAWLSVLASVGLIHWILPTSSLKSYFDNLYPSPTCISVFLIFDKENSLNLSDKISLVNEKEFSVKEWFGLLNSACYFSLFFIQHYEIQAFAINVRDVIGYMKS